MKNEENESSATKVNNPLTPQQDNRIFDSIPVRPAPWSKTETGAPMNKERALNMFRTANQWLYDKLTEGATCSCGNCYLCAYRFLEKPALVPAGVGNEGERPRIICLCGSTRFYKEFQRANYEETMRGHIVLSVGFYMHESEAAHGEKWGCTPEQKIALDALHFRKIELADEVLVLDVDGYIGESTRNEINHATTLHKRIRYRSHETAPAAALCTPENPNDH